MEILSSSQAYEADRKTIESGIKGEALMENAGNESAIFIKTKYPKVKTLTLCGPGNNGGDGFVIARHLRESGWDVEVASMIDKSSYKNDAQIMANKWDANCLNFSDISIDKYGLVVDAIFGIGLSKGIEGEVASLLKEINNSKIDVVAIDIPTGINCDNAEVLGISLKCKHTVTFKKKKFGHVLNPGKEYCGQVHVVDIGIKDDFIESSCYENTPKLWLSDFPFPNSKQHKYDRGHAAVVGGGASSAGASTLSANASLVTGAGLVTVACPKDALNIYATKLTAVMNKAIDSKQDFIKFIESDKISSVLIGPGNGLNERTKQFVLSALKLKKNCVIDADAISVFQDNPSELFDSISSKVILTPHEGEFKRLFSASGNKVERVLNAAKISNCIVVLKGSDTVIASPAGQLAINTNAPSTLATAGSGDVLAGIISGLLANKMDSFKSACAAVWVHSQAANVAGLGLTAEKIQDYIPNVLQELNELEV